MNKTFTSGRDVVGYIFWWGILIALFVFMYFLVPRHDIITHPVLFGTTWVFMLGIWIWLFKTTKYEFIQYTRNDTHVYTNTQTHKHDHKSNTTHAHATSKSTTPISSNLQVAQDSVESM